MAKYEEMLKQSNEEHDEVIQRRQDCRKVVFLDAIVSVKLCAINRTPSMKYNNFRRNACGANWQRKLIIKRIFIQNAAEAYLYE